MSSRIRAASKSRSARQAAAIMCCGVLAAAALTTGPVAADAVGPNSSPSPASEVEPGTEPTDDPSPSTPPTTPAPSPSPTQSEKDRKKAERERKKAEREQAQAEKERAAAEQEKAQQEAEAAERERERRERKKEKRKKEREERERAERAAADQAAALAAAREQLALLESEHALAKRELVAAKKAHSTAKKRYTAIAESTGITVEAEQTSWVEQLNNLFGAQVSHVTGQAVADESHEETDATHSADPVSADQVAEYQAARQAFEDARTRLTEVRQSIEVIEWSKRAAEATLGIASGTVSSSAALKAFSSYPVQDCEFESTTAPRSCTDAQEWALAEVANPSKDWFYLCLNFVANAYGDGFGIPRAIDAWNRIPADRKNPPSTVAPAGALMYWAPNHVALSLGNNMLVSTDVLGKGRPWIVSFETIQRVWNFPYLGWTGPEFH